MLSSSGHGDVEGLFDCRDVSRGLRLVDSGIPPPTSVVAYCRSDGDWLDVRKLCSLPLPGKLLELCVCHGFRRDTAVCAETRCWNINVAVILLNTNGSRFEVDKLYASAVEEDVYERKLKDLIAPLLVRRF